MKIVLALGGNALQADPKDASAEAQLKTCRETAKSVVDFIEAGHTIAIVHGNGPQVGNILASVECAHAADEKMVDFPFDVCGAFSQGYIGYHLQNAICVELKKRGIKKSVGTVITQTVVDPKDPGFQNPTKPVGPFYTKEEAETIAAEKGYTMKEDSGRGYRRVVASPQPVDIIERNIIEQLVDNGVVAISTGGGGIPVVRKENGEIVGAPAVLDKDRSAAKLAEILDADMFFVLTAVDRVCVNFNKPNQKALEEINTKDLEKYMAEGQFAPGSMLPKIEACKKFVETFHDRVAVIASLDKAKEALAGKTGTRIVY